MRNAIYICIAAVVLNSCGVAENLISTPYTNAVVKNSKGTEMLLGHCTRSCLLQKPFIDWFNPNYADYKVDSSLTGEIKKLMKKRNMTIFLGTWCGDSKREVPRMLKILDIAGVKQEQYNIVFVSNEPDMYKQSPQHEEVGKNIRRVPTFIIAEDKSEIGRIIESPKESLEKDLLKILQGKEYKPNYADLK